MQNIDFEKILSKMKAITYFEVESDPLDSFDLKKFRKALPEFKKYKFKEFNPDEEEIKKF